MVSARHLTVREQHRAMLAQCCRGDPGGYPDSKALDSAQDKTHYMGPAPKDLRPGVSSQLHRWVQEWQQEQFSTAHTVASSSD